MTRILAQYVSLATAALGLIELILSFLIIEAFLNMPGGFAAVSPATLPLDADLTRLAAMFAVITGGVATTIGLYRPEICRERRQLFVSAAVASLVAFPVLLLVSGGFHIGLTGWVILWLAVVLLVWQAGILLTHLAFSAVLRPDAMVRRVLILGSERRTAHLADVLRSPRMPAFEPVIAATTAVLSPDTCASGASGALSSPLTRREPNPSPCWTASCVARGSWASPPSASAIWGGSIWIPWIRSGCCAPTGSPRAG